jgi:hypothetical protein
MAFDEAQLGDLPPGYAPTKPTNKGWDNLVRPKKGERFGGRKKGSINKRTRAINLAMAQERLGITPLDGLLENAAISRALMLQAYEARGTPEFDLDEFARLNALNGENMAKCAPYCHSRLPPRAPEGELPQIDIDGLSDKQLELLVIRIGRRMGSDVIGVVGEPAEAEARGEG